MRGGWTKSEQAGAPGAGARILHGQHPKKPEKWWASFLLFKWGMGDPARQGQPLVTELRLVAWWGIAFEPGCSSHCQHPHIRSKALRTELFSSLEPCGLLDCSLSLLLKSSNTLKRTKNTITKTTVSITQNEELSPLSYLLQLFYL